MKHRAMRRLFRKMKGRPYEWMYRGAMSCAAAGRLLVLALVYPFSDREWVKYSAAKWKTVLQSMIGWYDVPMEQQPVARMETR